MAFPAFRDNYLKGDGNASSFSVSLSPSIEVGDVILINAAVLNGTPTLPAGWTEVVTGSYTYIWTKLATADDIGASFTVSVSATALYAWASISLVGVDPDVSSSVVAAPVRDQSGNVQPAVFPSLTAPWGVDDTLWMIVCSSKDDNRPLATLPSNYTGKRLSRRQGGNNNSITIASGYREHAVETESPTNGVMSADEQHQTTVVAFRPVGAAPAYPTATDNYGAHSYGLGFYGEQTYREIYLEEAAVYTDTFSYRLVKSTYGSLDTTFLSSSEFVLIKQAFATMPANYTFDLQLKYQVARAASDYAMSVAFQVAIVKEASVTIDVEYTVSGRAIFIKNVGMGADFSFVLAPYARHLWERDIDNTTEVWATPLQGETTWTRQIDDNLEQWSNG